MYDIVQAEPSEDFKRAWQAAARHLSPLGGDSFNWLRANLHRPFSEHLSFRIANKIFFVFVEAAEFQFGNWSKLFFAAARDANAIPCLMPMTERLGGYDPTYSAWGLVHAQTGEPVNPPDLVSDEKIEMTDWELRDFAIMVVKSSLKDQGRRIYSAQSSLEIDPSIWFDENGDGCWIVVRGARYPEVEAKIPDNIDEIAISSSREGRRGYFASVVVASSDDPFDPQAAVNGNFLPLYRGHAMTVKYYGLEQISG